MFGVPLVWKLRFPSKLLPRLHFLQQRILNAIQPYESELNEEKINSVYHRLHQLTQSPWILVMSGHSLRREQIVDLLKIPHVMLHEIEMAEYRLADFRDDFRSCGNIGEELSFQTPYWLLMYLQVENTGKKCPNGDVKLQLSDKTRLFLEEIKNCIPDDDMTDLIYVTETDPSIDTHTEYDPYLYQVARLLHPYGDTQKVMHKLFYCSETELPARLCRLLETRITETTEHIKCQLTEECSSYEQSFASIMDREFREGIIRRMSENSSQHLMRWLDRSDVKSGDLPLVLAKQIKDHVDCGLLEECMDVLRQIQHSCLVLQREDFQNVNLPEDNSDNVLEDIWELIVRYLRKNNAKQLVADHSFLAQTISSVKGNLLKSFDARLNLALHVLDGKCKSTKKLALSLDRAIEKCRLRLKEKIPHTIQVQAARLNDVKALSIADNQLTVYVTDECFSDQVKSDRIKHAFSHEKIIANVIILKYSSKLELWTLQSGLAIGFPNPSTISSTEQFHYGTIGALAKEACLNYAITCDHVTKTGIKMYTEHGNYIGKYTKETSISTSDEAFGNFLDFSAVSTELEVNPSIRLPNGEVTTVEIFDGDFEDLEKQDMFFYGATSECHKKVKYWTNECIENENPLPYSPKQTKIPLQRMRGIDILKYESGVQPKRGDSGSLVCYQDPQSGQTYAVFLFIGHYGNDTYACCRLSEAFDILADRGYSLSL